MYAVFTNEWSQFKHLQVKFNVAFPSRDEWLSNPPVSPDSDHVWYTLMPRGPSRVVF